MAPFVVVSTVAGCLEDNSSATDGQETPTGGTAHLVAEHRPAADPSADAVTDHDDPIFVDLPTADDGQPYADYEDELVRFNLSVDD